MRRQIYKAVELLQNHADGDFVSRADAAQASYQLMKLINDTLGDDKRVLVFSGIDDIHVSQILEDILKERDSAASKFPKFTSSIPMAGLIIGEEVGELQQAIVQYYDEDKQFEPIAKEAIQVACTAIRFLENIDRLRHETRNP